MQRNKTEYSKVILRSICAAAANNQMNKITSLIEHAKREGFEIDINAGESYFDLGWSAVFVGPCTPLMAAAKNGHYEACVLLIETYGAKVRALGGRFEDYNALDCAMAWGGNSKLITYLATQYIIQLNPQGTDAAKTLYLSSLSNDKDVIGLKTALSIPTEIGQSIVKLVLTPRWSLTSYGMYALSEALKVNKTLRILDLSSNTIGGSFWIYNSGFNYLLSALQDNIGLVKLILNDCALTPANVNALVAFMKQRQHQTLLQIELDDAAIAHLSAADKEVVLGREINEADYVAPPKVKPVPDNAVPFVTIIDRIQALLPTKDKEVYQALTSPLEAMKQIAIQDASNTPTTQLRFFNEVASLLEVYYHQTDAAPQWKEIQAIVLSAQETALAKWIATYDEVKPNDHSDAAQQEAALEAFYRAFTSPIQSLYKAADVIHSEHVECSKKTPLENVMDAGKHILFAIPLISESAHAVFHSVHALESTFHALQKFSVIAHVAEFLDEITEFKKLEEIIKQPKEKFVRLTHGATIEDKLHHLLHCFVSDQEFNSKLKSLSRAIAHHYGAQLARLSLAYAALWGQYAAVHLIDLFTSGIIKHPLTEEELCEQAILWLSHVPLRHSSVPKIKTEERGEHDISPLEGFTQAGIKFKDRNKKEHTCYAIVRHNNKKQGHQYPIHRNTQLPARWATQKELAAFNKFWNSPQQFTCVLDEKGERELIFDLAAVQSLKNTDFPIYVEKKSHLSKSKRIKELEEKNVQLEKKNVELKNELDTYKGKVDIVKNNLETTMTRLSDTESGLNQVLTRIDNLEHDQEVDPSKQKERKQIGAAKHNLDTPISYYSENKSLPFFSSSFKDSVNEKELPFATSTNLKSTQGGLSSALKRFNIMNQHAPIEHLIQSTNPPKTKDTQTVNDAKITRFGQTQ